MSGDGLCIAIPTAYSLHSGTLDRTNNIINAMNMMQRKFTCHSTHRPVRMRQSTVTRYILHPCILVHVHFERLGGTAQSHQTKCDLLLEISKEFFARGRRRRAA